MLLGIPEGSSASSSSMGSLSKEGLRKEAAMISTGPAAVRTPTTLPPTTWPCAPASEMVRPPDVAGDGRNAPDKDRISNRPWKVTVAPGAVGCRKVTFATVPVPLSTHKPLFLLLANAATLSPTSHPPTTSSTCDLIAFSLSRVMITGGLGLFLEPGGLPRGFLTTIVPSSALLGP